ncbi:hypothetical protein SAMN02745857_02771 [Andreprevotia lacus DSM 23236]|jgi:hypothetical protein|uniref:Uncharacterized protein n=1 Tax=Andreprevotia lacus DSM 23236 TaxID=1121001 RepID=A0A1W1XTN5_9NEIS|nr:hypothetical protein [Andreprevotia lacus]SMC27257.1 hypothetical protein SAMN02745857_02771 [Andreprevotia lacus DSM 23236]
MLGITFRNRGPFNISLLANDGYARGAASLLLTDAHLGPNQTIVVRPHLNGLAQCYISWSARNLQTGHVKFGQYSGFSMHTIDIGYF